MTSRFVIACAAAALSLGLANVARADLPARYGHPADAAPVQNNSQPVAQHDSQNRRDQSHGAWGRDNRQADEHATAQRDESGGNEVRNDDGRKDHYKNKNEKRHHDSRRYEHRAEQQRD